ncbi:unnamed protein product [Somion occarium]|uniref:Altered inheritance of mitochondria protein 41 n=1 Tax=Somion occarium TaxID=3059160 RepID=A0ABP1DM59_9APHY
MKAKDSAKSTTLRSVLTDVYAADKQKSQPIPNSKIQDIIRKAVDRRKDVASQYENASRSDLAEKERKEAAILSEFLPPQLSEEEIDCVLREVIQEQGLLKAEAKPNPKQALGKIFKAFYTRVDKSAVSSTEYVTRRAEAILTDASKSS